MNRKRRNSDPESKKILSELEEIATKLGFKVRYEKGSFRGGYCVIRQTRIILINSRNDPERRISILSGCLKEIGIDNIYIKPGLREIIEKQVDRTQTTEGGDE